MNYSVTERHGKQVVLCCLNEEQVHDYNANVYNQMNNAVGLIAFCKVCEWAGEPLRFGENTMTHSKLADFIKFFGMGTELIDVWKPTIVVIF